MTPMANEGTLLLPSGTRLVHIGPHKTGTTSLQAALYVGRPAMLEQGVRHAGLGRNPSTAVRAVTGRPSNYSDEAVPAIGHWRSLVREVERAKESRVVISSEFFSWAEPAAIRRIVTDLDPSRVQIAVTLRPLAKIIPSMWQQNVQGGTTTSFDAWLDKLFTPPQEKGNRAFWFLHRHDELIARWAEVVGPENVTVIVVDDRDHAMVLRAFEQLLGLANGTLVAIPDLANRSLTMPEAEAVRAFNIAFNAEGLSKAQHTRVMRLGAAQVMKHREPEPDEPSVQVPQWAVDRACEVAREMIGTIANSGVRVVGDLDALARARESRADDTGRPAVNPSPEIAASMAMGVLIATGGARREAKGPGRFPFAEPIEMARVPTFQVVVAVALRAMRAVSARWNGLRDRVRGVARPTD
ncbi:MAG: hypothetical protein MUQ32_03635 [Chloroflexi bacterium]|nr:hypothetical protein [Chloroflexota bacterium]